MPYNFFEARSVTQHGSLRFHLSWLPGFPEHWPYNHVLLPHTAFVRGRDLNSGFHVNIASMLLTESLTGNCSLHCKFISTA